MSPTVLVVDDSLTVRMDLVEAFERADFSVVGCASLEEAHAALLLHDVGLVVLDVVLPDGDGVELLRALKSDPARARTFVLMLSSESEVKDRIRALQTGADDYVGKPYDVQYVIARSRELLASVATPGATAGPSILIVDDSVTYRESLRAALEEAGYRVLVAESGEAGLALAASARPAVMIVDGMLPGIDGPTVIRRVRLDAALRATPCVLLTGSDMPHSELRALDAGADAFARKEDDFAILLARLSGLLRGAERTQGTPTASVLGPKKILAVDDSATYLQELGQMLRGEGYDVVLARSGEEALELIAVQPVDCILLDVMMPGMSGPETCQRIKSSAVFRDTPLIMLTALEDREAMLSGLLAGADDYISKSADLEVLRARVRAQLRRKQFETEARSAREQLLQLELEATEARAARELAETKAALVQELERKNRELEAFSYTVSHDLRAPLRAIDGFSKIVLDDHSSGLDAVGQAHLNRVRNAARRMTELIDDLLALSQLSKASLRREDVDLSKLVTAVVSQLREREPEREIEVHVEGGMGARVDARMTRIVFENLLGNAWKFTSKTAAARIDVRLVPRRGRSAIAISDNGAGFKMAYADMLFRPFQRLHGTSEFPGSGIGLATVHRIVERHDGWIEAEGEPGKGATFYLTLGPGPERRPSLVPLGGIE